VIPVGPMTIDDETEAVNLSLPTCGEDLTQPIFSFIIIHLGCRR